MTDQPRLPYTGDPESDALLEREPLALLIGLVLDQQQPIERAFRGPFDLVARGVALDARHIVGLPLAELSAAFSIVPALHRFPNSMAERTQQLAQHLVDRYDGDAGALWGSAPDGATLLKRAKALPGFGDHKAKVLVAILGKRLGLDLPGWQAASHPLGDPDTLASVADVDSFERLTQYREVKRARKAASSISAQACAPASSAPPVRSSETTGPASKANRQRPEQRNGLPGPTKQTPTTPTDGDAPSLGALARPPRSPKSKQGATPGRVR